MLRGSAPAGSRSSSAASDVYKRQEAVRCTAFSRRPCTSRISRASSGTTRGSASSAVSICATSVGVSSSRRSSTNTARARSIAAPSTKDVTSCCWALAASRMDSSASGEIRMFRRAERSGVWVGFMACLRTVTVCTACVRGQPGLVKVVRRFLIASLRPFPARRRGNRRPGTSRARQPASPERPPSRRCLARRPARSAVGEHDAEVTSRFGWFDTDGAQRRRMMEVVDLLRDEGTIDELGIGTIRDAIADALFPGLSVLHTRLRYVLFVPWLIDEAVVRAGGQQTPARLRRLETELIESLRTGTSDLDEDDGSGIIGTSARGRLLSLIHISEPTRLGMI